MGSHHFVSYSRVDGAEFALKLADSVEAEAQRLWIDTRELMPGAADWDDQIVEAIKSCEALLFVMTADSVRERSECKNEWVYALKYKKPVIPLLVDAEADLPLRLSSRQFVDFSGDFRAGLAGLRRYLRHIETPEGQLAELRNRLQDAERQLLYVTLDHKPRVEKEIVELRSRIAEQERVIADPLAARDRTQARVASALERERKPEPRPAAPVRAKFVNPPPMAPPDYFQGRDDQTQLLADAVRSDQTRIITVVGWGGVGKTAMACRLLKSLERGRLPDGLGELDVDGIVYLSPAGAHPVSWANLFADLCRVLPEETAERLLERYRDPLETPSRLMLSLLEAVGGDRVLVLLDNFEDLLDRETSEIDDPALREALYTVLTAPVHGVKLIVTSREVPRPLLLTEPARQRRIDLARGLESPYAEDVLRAMDADGSLGVRDAPDALLALARERTRGFPRALEALVAILSADRESTLEELVSEGAALPDNVVEAMVGDAFSRLDPLAQQVVQTLAIFREPVPAVAVDYVLQPYHHAIDSTPLLRRLVDARFVRRDGDRYYLHQVDREFALTRVPVGRKVDGAAHESPPFTRLALLARAAAYFSRTRRPGETWRNIDDLAPQLAEFDLRVEAEEYEAAATVLGGSVFNALRDWGEFRLLEALEERLRGKLRAPYFVAFNKFGLAVCAHLRGATDTAIDLQNEVLAVAREIGHLGLEMMALNSLGQCYGDRGEPATAIEYLDEGLVAVRKFGDSENEVVILGNIAECYAALGCTDRAIEYAEAALSLAEGAGYQAGAAFRLMTLGAFRLDLEQPREAADCLARAVTLADALGFVHVQKEARIVLARVHLHNADFRAAAEVAREAEQHEFALAAPAALVAHGLATARLGERSTAAGLFGQAVTAADVLVRGTSRNSAALDHRAVAHCGLALLDDPLHVDAATNDFRSARAITSDRGIVNRTLRLLDLLAPLDPEGILAPARAAAAGEEGT